MEDASYMSNERDYILAANKDYVFAIDLENSYCSLLAETTSVQPWQRAIWQRYLPSLLNTAESTVFYSDYYGCLMRNNADNTFWMYNNFTRDLFQPQSCTRAFDGAKLVAAAFLRVTKDSIVLLFDNQQLIVERCSNWFDSNNATTPLFSRSVAATPNYYTHIITDNVNKIILYGKDDVAVYNNLIQLKWSKQFEQNIIVCWLSQSGFWLFCLLENGVLYVFEKENGKILCQTETIITGVPTSSLAGAPSTSRTWSKNSIAKNTRVFPKKSFDGNEFYIVSQPPDSNITLLHTIKFKNL